jgi:dTDP-4-amino-4,6-dideoxygalactose transaminase
MPLHAQAPCKDVRCDPHGLASSEQHAATCVSLPCHPQMTDEQVRYVIASVNSWSS